MTYRLSLALLLGLATHLAWMLLHPLTFQMRPSGNSLVKPSLPLLRVSALTSQRWVACEGNTFPPSLREIRIEAPCYRPLLLTPSEQIEGREYQMRVAPLEWLLASPLTWLTGLSLAASWLWKRRGTSAAPPIIPQNPNCDRIGGYVVLQKLGGGATAEVFLGEEEGAGRTKVALKMLLPDICRDQDFKIRFEREADLCTRMNHQRIVKTYGWGVHEGRYWMAQQYLPGQSLQGWVKPGGRHPREVRKLLIQIAEGLAHAHGMGVYHRDLKPENVLLTQRGEPVIADFGMARSTNYETITRTGTTCGTPAYMAPEQIEGRRHNSGQADLYSLGVMAYELLLGYTPFQGDLMEVILAHLATPPPPLSSRRSDIPPGLEDIIMSLLQKDPARRPASAERLQELLKAVG